MDTQGQFDNFTSNKESASIFSISAFMSSFQIYNLKNNLEKTDLEYLSVFSEYIKVTQKLFKKSSQFEVIFIFFKYYLKLFNQENNFCSSLHF